MDRKDTIRSIKAGLQKRSGKTWSVTGGKGTAWGWLTIEAPPARRTEHTVKKEGRTSSNPEDYEYQDTGEKGGNTTLAEREELAKLLCVDSPVHHQGVSIPAGGDYWQEYIDRAWGRKPAKLGKVYWD